MAITDSSHTALEARVQQNVVRFLDVKPDWRPFTQHPQPGNDRAIFQYLGQNGHGEMDPWALPAQRFGLSLLYMPPGQRAPYHTHDTEEVFVVQHRCRGLLAANRPRRRQRAPCVPRGSSQGDHGRDLIARARVHRQFVKRKPLLSRS